MTSVNTLPLVTWQTLRDRLRPGQQRMADWQGGPLAVSAVPGSGKSTGMAIAAAILLAKRHQYFTQPTPNPSQEGNALTPNPSPQGRGEPDDSRLPTPDSRLPTPNSSLLTPHSSLSQPNALTPNPSPQGRGEPDDSQLPTPDCTGEVTSPLLSWLADFTPQSQLVLVTFTRSAAANLKAKIRDYLTELGLPVTGFVVYTLHGLALSIASRHPDLSGLNLDQMTLISPNQSHRLLKTAVEQWLALNPQLYQRLLEGQQFDGEETERLRRQSVLRTEVLPKLAHTVIHEAKSSGLSPEELQALSAEVQRQISTDEMDYDIPAIAAGLYHEYQTLLRSRNFLDYDDMILAALRVLEDHTARQLWQTQFFAVFEDEAQDSSPLQTRLLEILAAHPVDRERSLNLVRVGDPNQAINSTFTPSDPLFFREFCQRCQKGDRLAEMTQAGRSSPVIIRAANTMLDWVNQLQPTPSPSQEGNALTPNPSPHGRGAQENSSLLTPHSSLPQPTPSPSQEGNQTPNSELRTPNSASPSPSQEGNQTPNSELRTPNSASSLPFRPQTILPVEDNDPQPDANPEPEGTGVEIYFPADINKTMNALAERVSQLFASYPQGRVAVLVRENRQGQFLAKALRHPQDYEITTDLTQQEIDIYEVSERDRQSHIPAELLSLLQFCDRPHSPDYLKAALKILANRKLIPSQDLNRFTSIPEQFLYPNLLDEPPDENAVIQARRYCTSLLRARLELPHFQLIPFLAMTLRYEQSELATADKLAERLNQQINGDLSLKSLIDALLEVVNSERFEPVETDDPDSRYTRPGQLTIITMHKAKGLDWDFVFLPFLHDTLIPGKPWIPAQMQFLGNLDLAEVARAQIRASIHHAATIPSSTAAWTQAIALKQAEEYRLLYVAMTRAKRLVWMSAAHKAPFTWSKPDSLDNRTPCPVLPMLLNAGFKLSK